MNKQNSVYTRFIANKNYISRDNTPKIGVFVKKENEAGLSLWDITKYLKKNEEEKIFKLGDKKYAKKPPYTLARCDLKRLAIDNLFNKLGKKIKNINYRISEDLFSSHKDIRFDVSNNPAAIYHIAQELLNISEYKPRHRKNI